MHGAFGKFETPSLDTWRMLCWGLQDEVSQAIKDWQADMRWVRLQFETRAPSLKKNLPHCLVFSSESAKASAWFAQLQARIPRDAPERPICVVVCPDAQAVPLWQAAGVDDIWLQPSGAWVQQRLTHWMQCGDNRKKAQNWQDHRRIERLKDEFLATVSHELRTPLTSVLGALALLSAGVGEKSAETAQTLLDMAHRNGQRLGRLIDDLLDSTKLEDDRLSLHMQHQALHPLLQEALSANAAMAQKHGVHLRLQEAPQALFLHLDRDRFLQVLANLLSNAIKHSAPGDEVWLRSRQNAQGIAIEVQDSGPGIDDAFRPHLFEKFSQADGSDRRARGGTGLGLYITRLLVERMDGEILVNSKPGHGACFVLQFDNPETESPQHA